MFTSGKKDAGKSPPLVNPSNSHSNDAQTSGQTCYFDGLYLEADKSKQNLLCKQSGLVKKFTEERQTVKLSHFCLWKFLGNQHKHSFE